MNPAASPRAMCTVIARNYVATAAVLVESYRQAHPGHDVVTLVVDASADELAALQRSGAVGTVVGCDVLPLDRADLERMQVMYDVLELCTSLKPSLLQWMLSRPGAETALYLDPDCLVLGPLDDVHDAAAASGVALTPHVLTPMPRDHRLPDEEAIRHAGIFNLGVIAVSASAAGVLGWWAERLVTDAAVDLARALFTDQRWIDWLPALATPAVLRDQGLNAAYWNLHERPLQRRDGVLFAGEHPLRLMHFSGFDPEKPWLLTKHAEPQPRVTVSSSPELAALCVDYAERVLATRSSAPDVPTYGFGRTPGGISCDLTVRSILRKAVADADREDRPRPRFSFDDEASLYAVIDERIVEHGPVPLPRWVLAAYGARDDLRAAFPDLVGTDAWRLLDWAEYNEYAALDRAQSGLRPLVPTARPAPASEREHGGWNVVGHIEGQFGVGEAARRVIRAMELVGVPLHVVGRSAEATVGRSDPFRSANRRLRYADTVYCINADVMPSAITSLEGIAHDRGRRVAVWFWELSSVTPDMVEAAALVDEIWVASGFTADALRSAGVTNVKLFHLPALPSTPTPFTRADLGLPDGFVAATVIDFHSVARRKNALGVVEAFVRAFPREGDATLVVKTNHGNAHPRHLEELKWCARHRCDVMVVDGTWHPAAVGGLVQLVDCLVSLHRSEGFGLNILDAMVAGTPVIATAYGGNMQFCSDETVGLVPATLVPVGDDAPPYPADAEWGEPDLDVAAALLRDVARSPEPWRARAQRAQAFALSAHPLERAADEFRSWLVP